MKPLIVGQAPARGGTWPDVASGRRIAKLVGHGFEYDFVNLFKTYPGKAGKGDKFNAKLARRRADRLARKMFDGRSVILLGNNVARAFGFSMQPLAWFSWTLSLSLNEHKCCRVALLPHPSGVNRWWNEPRNVAAARKFLRQLCADGPGISRYAYEAFGFGPKIGGTLLGGIVDRPYP